MNLSRVSTIAIGYVSVLITLSVTVANCLCIFGNSSSCFLPCNCEYNDTCDPITGQCLPGDRCKIDLILSNHQPLGDHQNSYWGGGGCHRGNIAFGKPANQSGIYYDKTTRFEARPECALDGDLNTYSYSHKYIEGHSPIKWWSVNLGSLYTIEKVLIVSNDLGNIQIKLENYTVWVGNDSNVFNHTFCGNAPSPLVKTYQWEKTDPEYDIWNWNVVNCVSDLNGSYVSIRKADHDKTKGKLSLIEVAVIGYPASSVKLGYCLKYVEDNSTDSNNTTVKTLFDLKCEVCVEGWLPPDCKVPNITATTTTNFLETTESETTQVGIANNVDITTQWTIFNESYLSDTSTQDGFNSLRLPLWMVILIVVLTSVLIVTGSVLVVVCIKYNTKLAFLHQLRTWLCLKDNTKKVQNKKQKYKIKSYVPFIREGLLSVYVPPSARSCSSNGKPNNSSTLSVGENSDYKLASNQTGAEKVSQEDEKQKLCSSSSNGFCQKSGHNSYKKAETNLNNGDLFSNKPNIEQQQSNLINPIQSSNVYLSDRNCYNIPKNNCKYDNDNDIAIETGKHRNENNKLRNDNSYIKGEISHNLKDSDCYGNDGMIDGNDGMVDGNDGMVDELVLIPDCDIMDNNPVPSHDIGLANNTETGVYVQMPSNV